MRAWRLLAVVPVGALLAPGGLAEGAAQGGVDLAVRVEQLSTSPSFSVGMEVQFTIDVVNNSAVPSSGTTRVLVGPVPPDLRVASIAPVHGGWTCLPVVGAPQTYECVAVTPFPVGNTGPGPSRIALKVVPTEASSTQRTFPVTMTNDAPAGDPVPDNDRTVAIVLPVQLQSDLALRIVPDGPFTVGQQTSFRVIVTNRGPGTAPGPTLVYPVAELHHALTLVAASGDGWSCSTGSGVQCVSTASVPAGGQFPPLVYTVVPTEPLAPSFGIYLQVDHRAAFDPVHADNGVLTCVAVAPAGDPATARSDLAIDVTSGASSFTVDVVNTGPGSTAGSTCVSLVPPRGTRLSPASGEGWTCGTVPVPIFVCETTAVVAPGAAFPRIVVPFTVESGALPLGEPAAMVSNAWDVNLANDADPPIPSGGTTPVPPPTTVQATSTTVAPATTIPAAGPAVVPSSTPPLTLSGELPDTGATSSPGLLAIAVGALLLGGLAVRASRRGGVSSP